jgi:hypothetical protein
MGAGVAVGGSAPAKMLLPGGNIFKGESGLKKINIKYPAIQTVRINTMTVSMSQTCMREPFPLDALLIFS